MCFDSAGGAPPRPRLSVKARELVRRGTNRCDFSMTRDSASAPTRASDYAYLDTNDLGFSFKDGCRLKPATGGYRLGAVNVILVLCHPVCIETQIPVCPTDKQTRPGHGPAK